MKSFFVSIRRELPQDVSGISFLMKRMFEIETKSFPNINSMEYEMIFMLGNNRQFMNKSTSAP